MNGVTSRSALFVFVLAAAAGAPAFGGPDTPPERWAARSGVSTFSFDLEAMTGAGLALGEPNGITPVPRSASARQLAIMRHTSLGFTVSGGSVEAILGGRLEHLGDLTFVVGDGVYVISDPVIRPSEIEGALKSPWTATSPTIDGALVLRRVKAGFDRVSSTLTIRSPEVRISPALAGAMGAPHLADFVVGTATITAAVEWVGGTAPPAVTPAPPPGTAAMASGPDMTFCQLYGLYMPGGARLGDIVGLSVGTTSWNIGDEDLMWFPSPNEEHPFIVMNLYRLKDGRFEQIGQSHIKHGFYALGSHQCGGPPCTYEPGHGPGNWLGTGCTDTYSASLNAVQSGMGPRYEVNPWTGYWFYPGSHMDGYHNHDDGITHRIQVHDSDLDPALNAGATYYGEGYYVVLDDVNVMNSAAWKPVGVSGVPGGTWTFTMSSSGTYPQIGFAIDAWSSARQTLVAQEIPVEEFVSPDGRCVLAATSTELGDNTWRYEYALLNIDMDRQVGSFTIPIAPGTTVTNVGFHAVEHHDEPFNCEGPDQVAIDNAPWAMQVAADAVTWSTTSNPLRWGTLYNFRFDADAPPATIDATVGLFRPGTPGELTAETTGPEAICTADLDGDGNVGITDFLDLLAAWGTDPGGPPDLDGDGNVGILDFLALLAAWGPCP